MSGNKGLVKRERQKNFTEDERTAVIAFVAEHKNILESKNSDPRINKRKQHLWEQLASNLRSTGSNRDPKTIRSSYYRMKHQAKSSVSAYKKQLKKTGGGAGPSTEPTAMDWALVDISPQDFEEDPPLLDSDGVLLENVLTQEGTELETEHNDIVTGLIDPETGLITPTLQNDTSSEIRKVAVSSTTVEQTNLKEKKKRKRPIAMTESQFKMVALHEEHLHAKMENEKTVCDADKSLTDMKKEKEEELINLKIYHEKLLIDHSKKENELKLHLLNIQLERAQLELERVKKL